MSGSNGKTGDVQSVLSLLQLLDEIEIKMSELYGEISGRFSDNIEVHEFFRKMSDEETGHSSTIKFQFRIAQKNLKLFEHVHFPDTLEQISNFIKNIDAFKNKIQNSSLCMIMWKCLDIENNAYESHYRTALCSLSDEFSGLLKLLMRADREHSESIQSFAVKQGFLPSVADLSAK